MTRGMVLRPSATTLVPLTVRWTMWLARAENKINKINRMNGSRRSPVRGGACVLVARSGADLSLPSARRNGPYFQYAFISFTIIYAT